MTIKTTYRIKEYSQLFNVEEKGWKTLYQWRRVNEFSFVSRLQAIDFIGDRKHGIICSPRIIDFFDENGNAIKSKYINL